MEFETESGGIKTQYYMNRCDIVNCISVTFNSRFKCDDTGADACCFNPSIFHFIIIYRLRFLSAVMY